MVADRIVLPGDVGPADEGVASAVTVVPFDTFAGVPGFGPFHRIVLVGEDVVRHDTEAEIVATFAFHVGQVRVTVHITASCFCGQGEF